MGNTGRPSDRSEAVQRAFGSAARHYVTSPIHAHGPDLAAMIAAARPCPRDRVLDVGCGAGHTALAFAAHVQRVLAVDLTQAMLDTASALARERGLTNVDFDRAAAESLPYPDASFELVTSRYCAHHYRDPVRATREAARLLAPGGRYLLVDTVAPEDPAHDTFLNTLELLRDPSHVRDHTASRWREWFEAAGLACVQMTSFPLRIEFDAWVERIGTSVEARAMLCSLLAQAPRELRAALQVAGHDFTQDAVLLVGAKD